MSIQGIFFDLYGTLLVYGDMKQAWNDWLATFYDQLTAQGLNSSRAAFSQACDSFFSAAVPAGKDGHLTELERRIQRLCAALDHQPDPASLRDIADRIAAAWQSHVSIDPEAMPVLMDLKRRNKTVGLVSNFDHPPHVRRILSENGWATVFDTIVISGEVGLKKPDPAIDRPNRSTQGVENDGQSLLQSVLLADQTCQAAQAGSHLAGLTAEKEQVQVATADLD